MQTPPYQTIAATAEGPVGQLKLNRPDKLNAMSQQMLQEIVAAAHWFNEQAEVRVIIVTGAGRAFSAGADLEAFTGSTDGPARQDADWGRIMADTIEGMRAITIAAIHGWCVGGGVVLAAACDLRMAAEDARFSIPEIDLGIPLAWGGVPRLVREIGPAMTRELLLTCRQFDAEEARSIGLLNRVVPTGRLAEQSEQLACALAAKAAYPVTVTKRHVNDVTAQMAGTTASWRDADSVLIAFDDDECRRVRQEYLAAQRPSNG